MDTKNQLMREKARLLKQISESAQRGNSQEVLDAGEKLKKVESLIDRHEKLLLDISDLNNEDRITHPLQNTRVGSRGVGGEDHRRLDAASGRGIGRTIRMDFLKKAYEGGIYLEHLKGSVYETKSGHKVGIAVATERNPIAGFWVCLLKALIMLFCFASVILEILWKSASPRISLMNTATR